MAYASLQDLTERYGEDELIQLSDRADPPAGAIDASVIAAALASAEGLIDGFLAVRYRLPLAETPALVRDLACAFARHRLYKDRPTEAVQAQFEAAWKTLRDIAQGHLVLTVPSGAEPADDGSAVQTQSAARVFDRDSLDGY